MLTDPENLLLAYLHDPPDKALSIRDHVSRARDYAKALLERPVSEDEFARHADQVASAVERLPMPKFTADHPERAVGPVDGHLQVVHPLSGDWHPLSVSEHPPHDFIRGEFQRLAAVPDLRERFLACWRLLPERLAARFPWLDRLPADTRTPDHTIWNHLDITTGLRPAVAEAQGAAFLSFVLGPVQPFIAAARSVRDLWSGSMILSYLAFRAMMPVVEELGPTALVYPSLRETPLLDLWLRKKPELRKIMGKEPDVNVRKAPCLPHRFVAVVPSRLEGREEARNLARCCAEEALKAWKEIADAVKKELDHRWKGKPGWDRLWDTQIENYFDFRTAVLPCNEADDETLARLLAGSDTFSEAFPQAAAVRDLAEAIPEADRPSRYFQRSAGQWQHRLELSARLMEAQRSVRQVPAATPDEDVPPKCSVLGSYEQMGPAGLGESARFWDEAVEGFRKQTFDGVRLTARERFCAVSLVKRFCGPAFFGQELKLDRPERRFPDTATVAAATWLVQSRGRGFDWLDPDRVRDEHDRWSGQWLHWSTRNQDKDEIECPQEVFDQIKQARASAELKRPPAYYAILVMDGDDMGKWLSGQKSPQVREIMHPQLREQYFERLPRQDLVQKALNARRPVGPALHAAISEALANFALYVVPDVIQEHDGTLIYAGGDDVVALLPTGRALACARKLRRAFSGEQDVNNGADRGYYRVGVRDRLMMGREASLSAGLAVIHYKEDLRFALGEARRAEKRAKDGGKDALAVTVCRRSGEHGTALCGWDFVETVNRWVGKFKGDDSTPSREGASDRWAYHLKVELPTLRGLYALDPMAAEIRRQIRRAEKATQAAFPADDLEVAFRQYADFVLHGKRRPEDDAFRQAYPTAEEQERELCGRALEGFVALCQTASFLARGRDE